jgi:hypothetical protein
VIIKDKADYFVQRDSDKMDPGHEKIAGNGRGRFPCTLLHAIRFDPLVGGRAFACQRRKSESLRKRLGCR